MAEAEAPIEIEIDFDAAGAVSESDRFTAALVAMNRSTDAQMRATAALEAGQKRATNATREATTATTAQASAAQTAATAAIAFTQRLQGAASALQSLASAAGTSGSPAGAVARLAATTAQFAQLGLMLGPGGAVLGGIAGFIAGVRGMRQEQDAAAVAARAHAVALRETADAAAEAVRAAGTPEARVGRALSTAESEQRRREARERERRFEEGRYAPEEAGAAAAYLRERRDRLAGISARSRSGSTQAELFGGAADEFDERIRDAEAAASHTSRGGRTLDLTRRGGGGSNRPFSYDVDAQNDSDQNSRQRAVQGLELEQQRIEGVSARMRELREARDADAEASQRNAEAAAAALTEQADGARRLAEAEKAAFVEREQRETQEMERMQALADQKKALYAEQIAGYQEVTGVLVNGLVKASAAIADGSASAEEAFKGLLGSFLQYISQRAALEAAAEFAQAIGSFASYQYAAGAQHLAAGALWTGVAVATGVAGAAISRPSAPAQTGPERPPESSGSGSRDGGTTVINFNQPVVTAQGNAELGRLINRAASAGAQRFPGDV